jgi:uncharacterized membrane protein (Fun14 family)
MRLLFGLAALAVVAMFVTGIIYVQKDGDKAVITVDTKRLEAGAEKVVKRVSEKGQQILHDAQQTAEQAAANRPAQPTDK